MGEAAALASAFFWAASSIAFVSLGVSHPPLVVAAWRLVIAAATLFALLAISGQAGALTDAAPGTIALMALSGICANGAGDTIYMASLTLLGVQRAFPISITLFITLTVIGGIVLLGEPFHVLQGAGTVFVAAGIWLVARGRNPVAVAGGADRRGYLLVIVTGLFWTTSSLTLASQSADLPSIAISAIRTPSAGVVLCLLAAVAARERLLAPIHSAKALATLTFLGVLGTATGSLLYVVAVGEIGAGRTTVLSATGPLISLPLSYFFLRERVNVVAALGSLSCLAGVIFVVLGR